MPGKLEFSFNSSKLGEFQLDKEVMTIGRKDDNDICIDNLAVSGHHAKLLTLFDDSFLEDLDSTNGTLVNGKPIDKHPLHNGDVITIGKHELRYVNDNKVFDGDSEKTVLIRPKASVHSFPTVGAIGDAANSGQHDLQDSIDKLKHAKLQILNGKSAGKELALAKSSVKLGKAGSEVLQINKRSDGHFIVSLDDEATKLSTLVNGELIGSRAVKLHNHDIIEINRLKIEYYLTA